MFKQIIGEFRSFTTCLVEQGRQFRHPYPYIHHQNGKFERKHRHIIETGLTIFAQANLPLKFLWYAFHTATYIKNRFSTTVSDNKTPFEMLFHKKPAYSHIRIFAMLVILI